MRRTLRPLALLCGALLLAGCGGTNTPATTGATEAGSANSAGYPVTVASCGEQITFEHAPERVIMLTAVGASAMGDLGVLDKVIGRAGALDASIYPKEVAAQLDAIPVLDAGSSASGGAVLSTETVLEQRSDLVIGYDAGVDRKSLKDAGVPLYVPPSYCADFDEKHASFDLVHDETARLASIFGVAKKGEESNAALKKRIEDLPKASISGQSAAAYYVTLGVDQVTTYGAPSMVQPIFEVVGLENVYASHPERKLRIGMEAVLDKNPDWIVLLHQDGTAEQVREFFTKQKGVGDLKAVTEGHVVVMPFPYTDPPSPLSVEGVTFLNGELAKAGAK